MRYRIIAKSAYCICRVRVSVRMEQPYSQGTDFHEVLYWGN